MKKKINYQIEGLRGMAIMMILLYHLVDRFQQIYLNQNIRVMDFWGSFGVTIFLLISGFFAVNFDEEKCTKGKVVYALEKFFLRLWPTYMVCVIITFLLTQIKELPQRTYGIKELIFNLMGINHLLGDPYIDGAHWYMTVLIALFFVILLFRILGLHRNPFSYIIWIIGVSIIHFFNEDSFLFGGCFVGCYCVGVTINALIKEKEKDRLKWGGVVLVAFLETFITRGVVCTLELMVACVLLLLCIYNKIPFLGHGIFTWVGKVSYSLYLIHQNVGFWIECQLMNNSGSYKIKYVFIAIVIVFIFAVILFYTVETPSRKMIENKKRRK